ncbi:MAG: DNA polymerase III subunit alpha [Candidatus Eisenbacteria bacterium]
MPRRSSARPSSGPGRGRSPSPSPSAGVRSPRGAPGPPPVPLLARSAYSIGRGTALPDRLVARAADLGFPGLALADRDNLYGAIPFLKSCAAAGIHPVLGVEVSPRSGGPFLPGPESGLRGCERGPCAAAGALVLLVREPAGYASVCRILTARALAPEFDLIESVAHDCEGIAVLAREPEQLASLGGRLPRGALHALIVRPSPDREAEARLREEARRRSIPLLGSVDVYMAAPEEAEAHRVLAAIRELDLVSRLPDAALAPPSSYLADPGEVFDLFHDDPWLLAAARDLALSCRFSAADLARPGSLFPKLPLPEGETAYDRLHRMAQDGLRRRYRAVTREIVQRLAWELEQIDTLGFTDYFVVVGEIVAVARARAIPMVGRGSGASSLVSYLLGITNVDPIRYRLTFERFLHRLRRDLPDLDIDLCWRRRDEVIRHVYETYGADRVAMISTHAFYRARGAFREAAKALGITSAQIDRLARAIPSFADGPIAEAIRSTPLGRRLDLDAPPLAGAVAAAGRILGLPHTLGIHPGGIVIGPGPLDTWVPLEQATKGIVVTQYEMDAVEAVGLVKIDLLGNRSLTTIGETRERIRASGGEPPDLDALPGEDEATGRMLEAGDALGCFQIESPGMRNALKQLRTRDLEGTIAALSLIRPGPSSSGMKERFVRRARGLEPATYLHPSLEPILSSTYGILLFEEDVLCVASVIGGFDRALGDLLRRAIASAAAVSADPSLGERPYPRVPDPGRDGEDPWKGRPMRELENRFLTCAIRNGIAPDVARAVWEEMERFGSYAFCKAHASGYGVLAWQTSWLKAHHPGPFWAALLNNQAGMYPLRVHLEDARRHGLAIAPPCVHRSEAGWSWEDGSRLRCGLAQVKRLTRRTLDAILRCREEGPFEDLEDFLARTGASLAETASLVLCGALDGVGPGPRPARLWRLECFARSGHTPRGNGSARLGLAQPRAAAGGAAQGGPWHEFDEARRVRHELETLELAITAHPVAVLRKQGRLPSATPAALLPDEGTARVLGIASAARRLLTKKGEPMLFLTLEDDTGLAECVLFPPVYARYGDRVRGGALLLASGRVESAYGAPSLEVERLDRVAVADPLPESIGPLGSPRAPTGFE